MPLTKRTESNTVFLQAKHFCLWQELKKQVNGCEAVEVTNPKTKEVITKYGYRFDTVSGRVAKLVKYDTGDKYQTRYFGFKLHFVDGAERYVLDMPYQSQILRRFLRVARNIAWGTPLSITVFKGRKKERGDGEETGIWFQQAGETVKPYYTRENPHGMPPAVQDPDTHEWDFKSQHRWLVARLQDETIPDIEAAASSIEPDDVVRHEDAPAEPTIDDSYSQEITDDDVPF